MEIGVIVAGRTRGALAPRHGEYPDMFARLLAEALPETRLTPFWTVDGDPPPAPEAAEAWLVTGSRHGVYDDLPWIEPLKAWLRAARAARRPLIGVCFGHQIIAEAFGGAAGKHPGGWRIGRERYETRRLPAWAGAAEGPLALHALHQDQVSRAPEDATVWARGEDCEIAGLIYGDPERPEALSIQPHPEFDVAFSRDLARLLRDDAALPPETADRALESYGGATDAPRAARLFADYLRRGTGA